LVAVLTGESKPQLVLEELERESMFLIPLDTHRGWYRFHHLFRDMLRFKLRAERPALEARLLNQAASWHLERGEVSSGLEYLLRARNWNVALDVIMARGSEVFEKGEMATVIRWISQVPESARADRPDVSLLLGILMVLEGQTAGAESLLGRVATHVSSSPGERVCAHVFLSAMVQWRPRPETSVDMAVRALDELDHIGDNPLPAIMNLTHPASLETMAVLSCGRAHFQAGDLEQAREWLERGLATQGATYPIWKISGLGSLGLLEAWVGNTEQAVALSDEALAIAREVGLLAHPSIAEAYLTSTLVALERGEPGRASVSLHEGVLRARANVRSQLAWFGHLEAALLLEADGKREEAMTTVLSARSDLGAPAPPVIADRLLALQSRLLRLGGSPGLSQRSLRTVSSDSPALAFECAAAALSLGDDDLARKLVKTFSGTTDSMQPLATLDGLLLAAWLAQREGSFDVARTHLKEALAVAEGPSLVESFMRAGPTIVQMISDLPDAASALRGRILRRAQALVSPSVGSDLIEPLTDRELEILSYLPSRLTNTELADHFYVSVNTVKTHMAHIYRKLGVANRNDAISRAREIGFLQTV
jgi:LuxR family maltose regulon positive regulatory protein